MDKEVVDMPNMMMKLAHVVEVSIVDEYQKLVVKLASGDLEHLLISDEVKIYENENFSPMLLEDLDIGREISIYVSEKTPMMLSMPPQYTPALIIVSKNEDYMAHKLAYFDEDLISRDKSIKINESYLNQIESLTQPDLIKDILANQQLLVFYQQATRSIPAIVNPNKIIIF